MGRYWTPAVKSIHRSITTRRPEPGMLIAIDRKPWIVVGTRDVDENSFELIVHKPGQLHPHYGTTVPAYYMGWDLLPEHYAICVSCGELAPCREYEAEEYALRETQKMEELLSIPEGACMACNEPITARQNKITFDGPNLKNPLAPPNPTFHTRLRCMRDAASYEELWVKADPRNTRSLLTLKCDGTVIVHADGTGECIGAEHSDCPSIYAHHRGRGACYMHYHGCPKGCQRHNHPGISLRGYPTNPRNF